MNKIIFTGNLTQDPEAKTFKGDVSGTILNIANNEGYGDKRETTYFKVMGSRGLADACNNYLKKGSKVLVSGRLSGSNWEKNVNGEVVKMKDYIVFAENVEFLDSRNSDSPGSSSAKSNTNTTSSSQTEENDDIPF